MIAKRSDIPAPIIVGPSQTFDGIDGAFSSFNISVGTPPQTVKVFIGTSEWQTLVVVPEGSSVCGSETLSNCATLRGGEFVLNKSTTWQNNTADPSTNIYDLLVDRQLGYTGSAELGFDSVTLSGSPNVTLKNQTVGGFAAPDTYLGLFGVEPRSSTFKNAPPIPSYMQNLRNQSLIPSLSWAYTAGNQYRLGKVFGSLVLGGYDTSRFIANEGSWPIDESNNLLVQLQSITTAAAGGLLANPITVELDSSLPYLWLPTTACLLFENAFGLKWDNTSNLYLLDEAQHTALVQQNANVSFVLSGMTGSTSTVNITLPYAAFDLTFTASSPLVTNTTKYFPLRRAINSTQYLLGRTFFQEAYVIADYERMNFSVSPCKWDPNAKQNIAAIISPDLGSSAPGSTPPSPSPTPSNSGKSSNTGAIAGGVGGGLAAVIIAALIWFFWWRPKHRASAMHAEKTAPGPGAPALAIEDPHYDKAELGNTQKTTGVPELEGNEGSSSGGTLFEMPAREEVATEMASTSRQPQEMATPDQDSDAEGGYPWRAAPAESVSNRSPLSSPGLQNRISPMSSPSPGLSSRGLPSPLVSPSSVPSPVPSPPLVQPKPQRVLRPGLMSVNSSASVPR